MAGYIEVCVRAGWDWCYQVKPTNLVKTLKKLLKKHNELVVWISPPGDYYWYVFDKEELEKFIAGKTVTVTYHAEHPFFKGLKAFGTAKINIKDFMGVDQ